MNIKKINNEFRHINSKLVVTDTNTDFFIQSDIIQLHKGLNELLNKKLISKGLFLDAGCGDGRVIAITTMLGIPSIGVEYDHKLASIASEKIKKLGLNAIIKQGNFVNDEIYNCVGGFNKIKTVFNYFSGLELIAEKLTKDQTFILYTTQKEAYPLKLEHITTIELNKATTTYLHVYKK